MRNLSFHLDSSTHVVERLIYLTSTSKSSNNSLASFNYSTLAGNDVLTYSSIYDYPTTLLPAIATTVIQKPFNLWQEIVIWFFVGIVCFITVIGNIMVILAFLKDASIRQPNNYCIVSLAVSDLLIGLFSMPFYTLYLLLNYWPLGTLLCDLWLTTDYTACLVSQYTVLLITVDRFCSVKIPAKYRAWRTNKKLKGLIVFVWVLSFGIFFTSIVGWPLITKRRVRKSHECYVPFRNNKVFNTALIFGYFWISLLILLYLYYGIYRVAYRIAKKSDNRKLKTTLLRGNEIIFTTAKAPFPLSQSPHGSKYQSDEDRKAKQNSKLKHLLGPDHTKLIIEDYPDDEDTDNIIPYDSLRNKSISCDAGLSKLAENSNTKSAGRMMNKINVPGFKDKLLRSGIGVSFKKRKPTKSKHIHFANDNLINMIENSNVNLNSNGAFTESTFSSSNASNSLQTNSNTQSTLLSNNGPRSNSNFSNVLVIENTGANLADNLPILEQNNNENISTSMDEQIYRRKLPDIHLNVLNSSNINDLQEGTSYSDRQPNKNCLVGAHPEDTTSDTKLYIKHRNSKHLIRCKENLMRRKVRIFDIPIEDPTNSSNHKIKNEITNSTITDSSEEDDESFSNYPLLPKPGAPMKANRFKNSLQTCYNNSPVIKLKGLAKQFTKNGENIHNVIMQINEIKCQEPIEEVIDVRRGITNIELNQNEVKDVEKKEEDKDELKTNQSVTLINTESMKGVTNQLKIRRKLPSIPNTNGSRNKYDYDVTLIPSQVTNNIEGIQNIFHYDDNILPGVLSSQYKDGILAQTNEAIPKDPLSSQVISTENIVENQGNVAIEEIKKPLLKSKIMGKINSAHVTNKKSHSPSSNSLKLSSLKEMANTASSKMCPMKDFELALTKSQSAHKKLAQVDKDEDVSSFDVKASQFASYLSSIMKSQPTTQTTLRKSNLKNKIKDVEKAALLKRQKLALEEEMDDDSNEIGDENEELLNQTQKQISKNIKGASISKFSIPIIHGKFLDNLHSSKVENTKDDDEATRPKLLKKHGKKNSRARKALKTITCIMGAFVLCWTPFHVLETIWGFCDTCYINPHFYAFTYWLCYLNSPINPFMYALANVHFKQAFIKLLNCRNID